MPQKHPSKSTPSRRAGRRSPPDGARKPDPASVDRDPPVRPAPGVARRYEAYMRMLLDERRRLRQELSQMEEHQVRTEEKPVADVSGYEDDLVDVATETFEREKGLALESSVQGLLRMVEEALHKIREGTYGVCEGCGKSIDSNRLRAIPYARLCIRCKEREERLRSVVR
jgi:DnaK suppressor protein